MEKQIVSGTQFAIMIERLSHQLIENHGDFFDTILVGVQPRGVELLNRILNKLSQISNIHPQYGTLDITFFGMHFYTIRFLPLLA